MLPLNRVTYAPTIEVQRVVLRPFERDDLDALAATLANPIVARHLSPKPFSREDAWRRLVIMVGQWPLAGYGYWAVVLKESGRLVGHCGFADMERSMEPSIAGEPEMGWIFDPSVHGRGIAFDACTAALAWADRELDPESYPAIIGLDNAPSMRLAQRLSFQRMPDAIYKGEPVALFRRAAGRVR